MTVANANVDESSRVLNAAFHSLLTITPPGGYHYCPIVQMWKLRFRKLESFAQSCLVLLLKPMLLNKVCITVTHLHWGFLSSVNVPRKIWELVTSGKLNPTCYLAPLQALVNNVPLQSVFMAVILFGSMKYPRGRSGFSVHLKDGETEAQKGPPSEGKDMLGPEKEVLCPNLWEMVSSVLSPNLLFICLFVFKEHVSKNLDWIMLRPGLTPAHQWVSMVVLVVGDWFLCLGRT